MSATKAVDIEEVIRSEVDRRVKEATIQVDALIERAKKLKKEIEEGEDHPEVAQLVDDLYSTTRSDEQLLDEFREDAANGTVKGLRLKTQQDAIALVSNKTWWKHNGRQFLESFNEDPGETLDDLIERELKKKKFEASIDKKLSKSGLDAL